MFAQANLAIFYPFLFFFARPTSQTHSLPALPGIQKTKGKDSKKKKKKGNDSTVI